MSRSSLTLRPGARPSLTFKELLPDVARASPLLADVQELVGSRSARTVPQHRRIDARRVTARCVASARCGVGRAARSKGRHEAYAVQTGVNLVHEIFTLLQRSYPEYLWDGVRAARGVSCAMVAVVTRSWLASGVSVCVALAAVLRLARRRRSTARGASSAASSSSPAAEVDESGAAIVPVDCGGAPDLRDAVRALPRAGG